MPTKSAQDILRAGLFIFVRVELIDPTYRKIVWAKRVRHLKRSSLGEKTSSKSW